MKNTTVACAGSDLKIRNLERCGSNARDVTYGHTWNVRPMMVKASIFVTIVKTSAYVMYVEKKTNFFLYISHD